MIKCCLSIILFVYTAMKTILSLLFSLSFLCLKAQDQLSAIPHAEPGKTYAMCIHPFDTLYKKRGVLKVTFPQWENGIDTIFKTSENIQRVVTKSAATRWYFKHSDRNCLSAEPSNCITLAYVEISEQSQVIQFAENDSFKIVEVEHLARPASVEWVTPSSIPSTDSFIEVKPYESGEYRYFKDELNRTIYVYSTSNQWRAWREFLCLISYNDDFSSIKNIQKALQQKGYYSGSIDNILSNSTKYALVRFQKDNELPIGNLDFETLRALGVLPQPDRRFHQLNEW